MDLTLPQSYKITRRPLISVLDKMIALDIFKTLLSVWVVIVVIIVSRKFVRILDKAIEGHIANDTLLTILGLKIVTASTTLLPAATFMALLMVLGRLYKDHEMSAIAAAGGGSRTLYRSVFLLVLPLSLFASCLSLYIAPWAENRIQRLMNQDEQTSDVRGIAAGKFTEYSRGNLVFYVEKLTSDNKMHSVFMQNRQKNKLSIVRAERSRLEDVSGGRYMIFEKGERIEGKPGDYNYSIEKFDEYAFKIMEKALSNYLTPSAVATPDLWKSKLKAYTAELQDRLALPVNIILLSFIAVPLARISPRGGIYGSMLMGFLIYFSFGNLAGVLNSWVTKGSISPWPGILWVDLALLTIGLGLLANWYGFKWLIHTFKNRFFP